MKRISALGVIGVSLCVWAAACTDEGVRYLTSVDEEAPGSNCADGGQQIDFGADADANGELTPSEVTSSAFVCNGAASRGATVSSAPLPVGDTSCPSGGYAITAGVDRNGNGAVDGDEGVARYICNGASGQGTSGAQGPAGSPGPSGAVGDAGASGPQGDPGTPGGQGAPGTPGTPGTPGAGGEPGTPGAGSLITITDLDPGGVCLTGGIQIDVGQDDDPADGTLSIDEIEDTAVVCRSAPLECDTPLDCDDSNECTLDECRLGACTHVADTGASCGDPTVVECNAADTCDAQGVCQPNLGTLGDSCGDSTDNDCNGADTCDASGSCQDNLASLGDACGSTTSDACTTPDSCDGGGLCLPNNELDGTVCGPIGTCGAEVCTTGVCAAPFCSMLQNANFDAGSAGWLMNNNPTNGGDTTALFTVVSGALRSDSSNGPSARLALQGFVVPATLSAATFSMDFAQDAGGQVPSAVPTIVKGGLNGDAFRVDIIANASTIEESFTTPVLFELFAPTSAMGTIGGPRVTITADSAALTTFLSGHLGETLLLRFGQVETSFGWTSELDNVALNLAP